MKKGVETELELQTRSEPLSTLSLSQILTGRVCSSLEQENGLELKDEKIKQLEEIVTTLKNQLAEYERIKNDGVVDIISNAYCTFSSMRAHQVDCYHMVEED